MNKSTFEQIGDKIRGLRLNYRSVALSRELLAMRLGIAANRVTQRETGAEKPTRENLDQLERFFRVSISVFFPELKHQRYIASQELNSDLQFVDISPVFQLPEGLKEEDLMEGWTLGYRLMCRFHSYYIWQYAAQFDYIMRLGRRLYANFGCV